MTASANDTATVVLIHSNDLHSHLEHAAQISTYIEQARQNVASQQLLVFDVGDHMDRMRMETEGTDGLVNVALLNHIGYHAVTMGNNEGLSFSYEQLTELYEHRAHFSVLCANMLRMDDDAPSGVFCPTWLQPSCTIEKNGITFGVVAATAAFPDFYRLLGWEAGEPIAAIRHEVEKLRAHVDVIVVLSHLGIQHDRRLAHETTGIDLILGGHTHHLFMEPEQVGSTLLCAAGKFGEYVGRIEIHKNNTTGQLHFHARCESVVGLVPDPRAITIIREHEIIAEQQLSHVVTTLARELPVAVDQESVFANLLAAGLRRWTNAQIGLVNAGQLLQGLREGPVSKGDLHALCPSPINPCLMDLRGSDIRIALEQSLSIDFQQKAIRGFGFRGKVLGTLAVDGLQIFCESSTTGAPIIQQIWVADELLEDERIYRVGTIDMFTFGIGYLSLKNGANVEFFVPEMLRDLLADQLQRADELARCDDRRWFYN